MDKKILTIGRYEASVFAENYYDDGMYSMSLIPTIECEHTRYSDTIMLSWLFFSVGFSLYKKPDTPKEFNIR